MRRNIGDINLGMILVPLAFVADAPLVAHNAGFDIAFLNAELKAADKGADRDGPRG